MSRIILIRLQPPLEKGRASIYDLGDAEEKMGTGPTDNDESLKDYVRTKMEGLLEQGDRKFVIDLALVKWVSSSEVGMMLAWYRLASKYKGTLVLANLSQSIGEVMKVTRLDTVMKVFGSIPDAKKHLASS